MSIASQDTANLDAVTLGEVAVDTVKLYRAVGPGQLQSIVAMGWKAFPPRRVSQRYFYPMLHASFAHKIAGDWNVRQSGVGYVVGFKVRKAFLEGYSIYRIGGPEHREYRIPATDLDGLNANIVGDIELLGIYHNAGLVEDAALSDVEFDLPYSAPASVKGISEERRYAALGSATA